MAWGERVAPERVATQPPPEENSTRGRTSAVKPGLLTFLTLTLRSALQDSHPGPHSPPPRPHVPPIQPPYHVESSVPGSTPELQASG